MNFIIILFINLYFFSLGLLYVAGIKTRTYNGFG
jgi:hypothetical protein